MRVSFISAVAASGVAAVAVVNIVAWRGSRALKEEMATHEHEVARSRATDDARERVLREVAAREDAARVRLLALQDLTPEESEAVRFVTKSLEEHGLPPSEYFASFTAEGHTLIFSLRHDTHPSDLWERGDACGKCRTAIFNSVDRTVRIYGVR